MLLAHMGSQDVGVEIDDGTEQIKITLRTSEEDSGMMIGRRGETLEAIQRILSLTFRDELGEKRISVTVNDYLDRRLEVVQKIAEEALERVTQSGRPMTLPYLSSEERRNIHTMMKERGVDTRSDGSGHDRRLTMYPQGYLLQDSNEETV